MTRTGKNSIKKSQINNSFNNSDLQRESIFTENESGTSYQIPETGVTNSKDNDNFIRDTHKQLAIQDPEQVMRPDVEIPIIEIPIIIKSQKETGRGATTGQK